MSDKGIELEDEAAIFSYPLRHRLPGYVFLGYLLLFDLLVIVILIVTVFRIDTGRSLPGELVVGEIVGPLVVVAFMNFIAILVQMLFPAIHITNNRFRIKNLFYTSPWLRWEDIRDIQPHWLSTSKRRIIGVTVEGISPLYSLIGFVQLLGMTGFLIYDGIERYTELMHLLQKHRGDLFE